MNIKTILIVLYLLKKAVMSVVYIKMAYIEKVSKLCVLARFEMPESLNCSSISLAL